jgi:hypothetical protein
MIMKKLTFPLTVTTFSQSDCPHALVYAPLCFQGLNIPDLFIEQGISKIVRLVKYGQNSQHITSCLIRHNCEAMKMEFGLNGYLFHHEPVQWEAVITPSWLKFTWKFLMKHDIQLRDDLPDFPMLRENDRPIMEALGELGWSDHHMYKLNICRMFLQVVTMAEITNGDGTRLAYDAWTGTKSITNNTSYRWPFQPNPPPSFWTVWKKALSCLCRRQYTLKNPLGRWSPAGASNALWWFDQTTESLFKATTPPITFPFRSARTTRFADLRYNKSKSTPSQIPSSATPCVVSQQGAFLIFHGTADIVRSNEIPLPSNTFEQFINAKESNRWVYDNVQAKGSMESLALAITNGSCTCVADGSFKDKHGTAAWKILDLATPENSIEGQSITPGDPCQQNPYRSELSGLFASTTMINNLVEFFQIESGAVTLACDNLGAITITEYTPEGTSPSACAQFDLVMAIQRRKSKKIKWMHKHVYGHQDTKSSAPLSPIKLINVDMDAKAKRHWAETKKHPSSGQSSMLRR